MYKCYLELSNKDEWLQHLSKIVESNQAKNNEELLMDICNFDFKFDTIVISQ